MTTPTRRTSADIVVRDCTVTVVRRGGWSWGPDPTALVDQVLAALPDLLTERFADQVTEDGPDVEITDPVLVTARLDTRRWSGSGAPPVDIRIDPAPAGGVPAAAPAVPDGDAVSFAESFLPRPAWSPPLVTDLFTDLAERGELDAVLALLPVESLRVYLAALLDVVSTDPAAARSTADWSTPLTRLTAELRRRAEPRHGSTATADQTHHGPQPSTPDGDTAAVVRLARSLLASTATTAPAADATTHPAAGQQSTPDGGEAAPTGATAVPASGPPPPAPAAPAPAAGPLPAPAVGETRVWSVLPFLIAGPLARVGYLDAIGPALAGLDLADAAPLFATALAYKVLGLTERGWRRTERDSTAAAAFAGLDAPVPEDALVGFARQVRPALPVLDGVLSLALCRGHDPADPLLVTGVADQLLLVDAQGVFPIAWSAGVPGLLPHWRACGRPPVLVCAGPLPSGCLAELAAAGVRFVTDARPLRGDPVTRLPLPTPLWTSSGPRPDLRLAASLPGHAGRLGELVRALVVERRAVPLAADDDLERSLTVAAGLGLGLIAWTLWHDRETPDPVLALARLADLEATVRFERAAVRVRMPLGRRHADLLRAGLLADVRDVVWLGGRSLTFSGG